MKHKVVIFDWDGTLMDSAHKIVISMQMAADSVALPVPSAHAVRQIIGISLKPAIIQLFGLKENGLADKMVASYKRAYADNHHVPSPLFDGVIPLLTQLQSGEQDLAVATGKARKGLNNAWQQSDTQHFFATSRCADEALSKPEPDMLIQILKELKVEASEAVMIGDTSYDMAMAETIGMDRIGVSYGVHDNQQLEKHAPLAIIDRPLDLLDLI